MFPYSDCWIWLNFADWLPQYLDTREQKQTAGKYLASFLCFACFVSLKLNNDSASMSCSTMFESRTWLGVSTKHIAVKTATYNYGIVLHTNPKHRKITQCCLYHHHDPQSIVYCWSRLPRKLDFLLATCIEYLHNQPIEIRHSRMPTHKLTERFQSCSAQRDVGPLG